MTEQEVKYLCDTVRKTCLDIHRDHRWGHLEIRNFILTEGYERSASCDS